MHGIGNDFIVLDAFEDNELPPDLSHFARLSCDRRRGVGGDGLLVLEKGAASAIQMRMWNPDGSVSEMCGNGLRCVVQLASERGYIGSEPVDVETGAGTLRADVHGAGLVKINMGQYRVAPAEIPMNASGDEFLSQPIGDGFLGSAISMGNPHLVIFVPNVGEIDLDILGPKLENHPLFPERTNVHFVEVAGHGHLIQRTWERGAGVTLACGTGACACAVAGFLNGSSERSVTIELPGGKLFIEVQDNREVIMTGPTRTVFRGEFEFVSDVN